MAIQDNHNSSSSNNNKKTTTPFRSNRAVAMGDNDDEHSKPDTTAPHHGYVAVPANEKEHLVVGPSADNKSADEKKAAHLHDEEDGDCDTTWDGSSASSLDSSQLIITEKHSMDDEEEDPEAPRSQAAVVPVFDLDDSSSSSEDDDDEAATQEDDSNGWKDTLGLLGCFFGILASFVGYGLLLEYTTSGGRRLHELSLLFVTSALGSLTAWIGRWARQETPSNIPPLRFAVLGFTSMGSTWCAVRSLRYVIYPVQVMARSCKPVPVMVIGTILGKKYPLRKYISVIFVVLGVALFMGGGNTAADDSSDDSSDDSDNDATFTWAQQGMGLVLLSLSLCFDGWTGAYEDKLTSVHEVGPFDLMFKIQVSKTVLSGLLLLVLGQVDDFVDMIKGTGIPLLLLGLSSAIGQVFIFITIAKFGALTCSLMSLTRKVTTLAFSIVIYGHPVNGIQLVGLVVGIGAMTSMSVKSCVCCFGGVSCRRPQRKDLVVVPTLERTESQETQGLVKETTAV